MVTILDQYSNNSDSDTLKLSSRPAHQSFMNEQYVDHMVILKLTKAIIASVRFYVWLLW